MLAVVGSASAGLADSSWSKYQGDGRNSGCTDIVAYGGKIGWSKPISNWWTSQTACAVGSDGVIYATTHEGLVALNPNGSTKWTYNSEVGQGTPLIGSDGTVYYIASNFNTTNVKIYAIKPDGTQKWSFNATDSTLGSTSLAMDNLGTLHFGALMGVLYSIRSDNGRLKTRHTLNGINGNAAIRPDGTTVITDAFGRVYAYDPYGIEKWSTLFSSDISSMYSSPAVGMDNTTYLVSGIPHYQDVPGVLSAVDATGHLKWSSEIGGSFAGPAIGQDGTIYVVDEDAALRAYSTAGSLLWKYAAPDVHTVRYAPLIDGAGTIYFSGTSLPNNTYGGGHDYLIAVNPDGTSRWQMNCPTGPLAIGPQGQIYINSGYITCVVPEPSSIFVLVCGIGAMGGLARRKAK